MGSAPNCCRLCRHLHLQGGGECATESACKGALNGPLGSSKYFQPAITMPYFLSDDEAANPDFYDWNHVDIPYCSQVGSGSGALGPMCAQ